MAFNCYAHNWSSVYEMCPICCQSSIKTTSSSNSELIYRFHEDDAAKEIAVLKTEIYTLKYGIETLTAEADRWKRKAEERTEAAERMQDENAKLREAALHMYGAIRAVQHSTEESRNARQWAKDLADDMEEFLKGIV